MPKRILIAEDEPNIAKSLTFLLERAGFEAIVEGDGDRVADLVWAQNPDALLLDVMLPGSDGYQILKSLRADPRTTDLPVMILTAKGQQEDRRMAMEAGATEFVTKPFSNADVTDGVQRMLERH